MKMAKREATMILTPVGRLVQGSLYTPNTTNAYGKPLVNSRGEPRVEFYFALAIKKNGEQHWSQTKWGEAIWAVGHQYTPNAAHVPVFAWKITDGDSQIPNAKGKKPTDREGYPGHWVLNFANGFAPILCQQDGALLTLPPNAINLGDYVQVYGSVRDNATPQHPGIFLNCSHVALIGYGQRIVATPTLDPTTIGFGAPLPPGASITPIGTVPVGIPIGTVPIGVQNPPQFSGYTPPTPAPLPQIQQTPQVPIPITPHPTILNVPTPQVRKMMTGKAAGATYEQYIAAGWKDSDLIAHGYMLP
jgi:hypothetical protein